MLKTKRTKYYISIWTQQYWNNEGLNKLNNFVFDHWTIITDHQHFISWPATILKADTFLQPVTSVGTELLSSLLRISVHCNYVQVIIWFRVQFGMNLLEWVFQKAEIARAASASAILQVHHVVFIPWIKLCSVVRFMAFCLQNSWPSFSVNIFVVSIFVFPNCRPVRSRYLFRE